MKHKLWLLQLPIVAVLTLCYLTYEKGRSGELENAFLRESVFPALRVLQGQLTNLKFKARGPVAPKNKIAIVEIDSPSLEQMGRWPWHRNVSAKLIDRIFDAGAKAVALDIVFSELDQRVSDDVKMLLTQNELGYMIGDLETDPMLAAVIQKYPDRLVLGWMSEQSCSHPRFDTQDICPYPDMTSAEGDLPWPPGFEKFAFDTFESGGREFDTSNSRFPTVMQFIANHELFSAPAKHSGYLMPLPDADGYIRRAAMFMMAKKKPYPSVALALAKIIKQDRLKLVLNEDQGVREIGFEKDSEALTVTQTGAMEINFRGPAQTFQYIRAADLLQDPGTEELTYYVSKGRELASVKSDEVREMLRDAVVFVGVTAIGVNDIRAMPFDSHTPGVEGHANILDNILSNDMLIEASGYARVFLLVLMTLGALIFAYWSERLESIPALLLFVLVIGGVGVSDFKLLFGNNNINWNTSLLYLEYGVIFGSIIAFKYVMEERNKKFIRGAFTRYVSPAIVDSILKDPSKLTVGGEKRELTILFSDIRGFTTFSEKMDAKALAVFLNDYLGIMTDLVFDCEGTLDKYIGDAVMAFWGAPLDQKNHAANSCQAAIKMLRALDQHRPRFLSQYGVEVNIGIGINSGAVNVGNMGSSRIFEYTVIGDHVNLASRLEGLTKYYGVGIITTRFTFDAIKESGDAEPPHRVLDFVKVKGKKKAVELIQVLERELPADCLKAFEEARALYSARKWDDAAAAFRAANELIRQKTGADDAPSLLYAERCEEFKKFPPNADWDGSWEMHSK